MQTTVCPSCGDPLAESTEYCAKCREAALSSETTLDCTTTAVAQGTPLADIPSTPMIEENETVQRLVNSLAPSTVSDARASSEPQNVAIEPGESESTIRLPFKLTRQKSAAREYGQAKVTRPLPDSAVGLKDAPSEPGEAETTIRLPRGSTRASRAVSPVLDDAESTIRLPHKAIKQQSKRKQGLAASTLKLPPFLRKNARARLEEDLQASFDETAREDLDDEVIAHHENWQKVVEHKTTQHIPVVLPSAKTKRGPSWFSVLLGRRATRSFFWLSTLILIALLLSGAFGLAASFGRTVQKTVSNPPPTLLGSPTSIALGGIVTLNGLHFTPGGEVTLSRDRAIALVDTSGASTISADARGLFNDTFVVDPDWLSGAHTLYATDVRTHKQATFPLLVTGQSALQGPPHLLLSSSSLNLGSGDETTASSKVIALSNAGGSVATWQANSNQPWLQITPQNGSIASGKHMSVTIAGDRSTLAPGSYHGTISFISSTGEGVLAVQLEVTDLQPSHQASLQISSGSLAFHGTANGASSGDQTITLYNSGSLPLTWGASISGSNWLWASPSSGTISPGNAQRVTIGVVTSHLSSGTYKGSITFSNQGSQPVQGSPQTVYVSLTTTQSCALTLSASSLSFTSMHGGSSPAGKSLNIGMSQGCTTNQHWSVTAATSSGGNWLAVSSASGTTPATVSVSAATSSLAPGTYKGTLTVKSSSGSKAVSVTLTVTSIPCTVSGSSTLALQGTAGQSSPVSQNATINASGDCLHALNWSSSTSGGWLSAASSGTFTASTTVNVQSNLAGLSAGTYNGSVTITIVDSSTNQTVGTVTVAVTLTAQQPTPPAVPCSLQAASPGTLNFTANKGSDPTTPTANITISVTGSCSGNVTITPSVDSAGNGWVSVSGPVSIASGSTATFTVTVSSVSQKRGTYTSTITLTASNGISGSQSTVTVTLTVQ